MKYNRTKPTFLYLVQYTAKKCEPKLVDVFYTIDHNESSRKTLSNHDPFDFKTT